MIHTAEHPLRVSTNVAISHDVACVFQWLKYGPHQLIAVPRRTQSGISFSQAKCCRVVHNRQEPHTAHPTDQWVTQQARNFVMQVEDMGEQVTDVIHDWDTKYTERFGNALKGEGARVHRKGPATPNMNAYAERFVQTIKQECLDHFIVLGERHLNYIVAEYVTHYHEERPHQALGNAPPAGLTLTQDGEVVCRERLGGLLRH